MNFNSDLVGSKTSAEMTEKYTLKLTKKEIFPVFYYSDICFLLERFKVCLCFFCDVVKTHFSAITVKSSFKAFSKKICSWRSVIIIKTSTSNGFYD